MVNSNTKFLLDGPALKQVIYLSMIVGNILFVSLHPMHIQVDVIAALYFLLGCSVSYRSGTHTVY